ncbi:GTPase [Desulfonema limicola]|uniref:GTPase Obg n=1 Tax=Desulfonema limicola TaxID=45656 RepID=A0A975GG43_9BACT|nr:GTPase ObgE [Desulfonema limicola]QTA79858.1 GTPase [Desulfonema limicola]
MKFIDEALITVRSGDGGRGCVSFRRERFIPKGGPDGGDGGKGGDVIFTTASQKRTLYHLQYKKHYKAKNGQGGQGNQKTGRGGDDVIIDIPPGTLVSDADTGEIIKDFTQPDETFIIAHGGRGGQGNLRFKSSTNRVPRFAQPGEPGQTLNLKLDLKLLADVGIMGFPNAGKSTLISVISSAKPKVADYPFTTLIPNLGVVKTDMGEPFVVADIPGLIEGAHTGAGLGIQFLRHIERTSILIHLIDALDIDPDNPLSRYRAINSELARYSPALSEKPQVVVLNKMDMPGADVAAELFESAVKDSKEEIDFICISAVTGKDIDKLKIKIVQYLDLYQKSPVRENSFQENQDHENYPANLF